MVYIIYTICTQEVKKIFRGTNKRQRRMESGTTCIRTMVSDCVRSAHNDFSDRIIAMGKQTALFLMLALICACGLARAENLEVPGTGRWEGMAFSSSEVDSLAQEKYDQMLSDYADNKQLDADVGMTRRVQRIGAVLVASSATFKAPVAAWKWEFHTTSNANVDALSLAGGKIMIGSAFVNNLKLTDGELAMLIAHEMAHAIAEHQREELSEAQQIKGGRLTARIVMADLELELGLQIKLYGLSSMQEAEADELGMLIAHRAGWDSGDMVSFYVKLAASEPGAAESHAYPTMASRLSMARGMERLFASVEN